MARLVVALMWVLHFLPMRALAAVGAAGGELLHACARERRAIAAANVGLCFPELDRNARDALVRRHFRALGRSFLERGLLWWASPARIERLVRFVDVEHWHRVQGQAVILLAPHFVGMEMGGTRAAMEPTPVATMYSRQKNRYFDAVLLRGRSRFARVPIFSRHQGARSIVRGLKSGHTLYYLPDMDFGARDALFVPFFGVPAATITGLSRIAALSGAAVVPCITRQLPGKAGYEVRFYPKWEDFPSADPALDARRMNAFIEERVREMPEQYYWVHKRFKTRPQGEPDLYASHAAAD